jgi:hypothetical protein
MPELTYVVIITVRMKKTDEDLFIFRFSMRLISNNLMRF